MRFGRLRRLFVEPPPVAPAAPGPRPPGRNIFEAAAARVAAAAEEDEVAAEEAAGWVSPEALAFGIEELARRAVLVLARERDEPPGTVARLLLGLPAR